MSRQCQTCPHCGAAIRFAGDAFCSECRNSFDAEDCSDSVATPQDAFATAKPSSPQLFNATLRPRRPARDVRHTGWFLLVFYALAVVSGVRDIWFWKSSLLDLLIPVVFDICLGWWAIVDSRRRKHPIPLLSKPWFYLFAWLLVPGYVVWTRGGRGLGWIVLHCVCWCVLAVGAMFVGGALFGVRWQGGR